MSQAEYIDSIQDARLAIDVLVGARQRLMVHPRQGITVEQHVPEDVTMAYQRLRKTGFTSRIVPDTVAQG